MSSLEKRQKKIMNVWDEINGILDKNNVSMYALNGVISIYDQNRIGDDSVVLKNETKNAINFNYDDTPF